MLERIRIKKVCCVTVDNLSANNVALTYLIREMSDIGKRACFNFSPCKIKNLI
jgi:hypothetical protein